MPVRPDIQVLGASRSLCKNCFHTLTYEQTLRVILTTVLLPLEP
jgi:hypothetical protein